MNDDARLERIFSDALAESAPSRAPDRLRADIKHAVGQTRPRPRWLATLREAPMHTLSTATVGSSTARRATAPPLRLAWLLLVALLVLALAAGGLIVGSRLLGATAPPIPQGGAAVLVFDASGHIFTVRADGTDLRQLTSGSGTDSHPIWSPDGKRIAYRHVQGATNSLIVVDAGGADPVTLDEWMGPADFCGWWSTTWSPDGSGLVFPVGRACREATQLQVVKTDGSAPATSLLVSGVDGKWPTWSPDETRIAFLGSELGGADGLYVVDVTASDAFAGGLRPTRIGPDLPFNYIDEPSRPQWSPDSSELAVVAGSSRVLAVKADGSAQRVVVGDDAHNPTWSPDGTRIAYQRPVDPSEYFNDRPCTVRTWIADPDGATERELEELGDGCEVSPVWSPDGTRLASLLITATDDDPTLDLHLGIVTLDGSSPVTVLPDGQSGSWQPLAVPLPPALSPTAGSPAP